MRIAHRIAVMTVLLFPSIIRRPLSHCIVKSPATIWADTMGDISRLFRDIIFVRLPHGELCYLWGFAIIRCHRLGTLHYPGTARIPQSLS
ncbi:hypothetical protein BDY19DRAFT_960231 [Irpex rosettiformis]|uniref:Uncharacterized protein n=1 Tax=Irpex rosettiformis TaxID=378272 RepID=A0ACB8TXG4_9APHY|nr:hypothetical protein BDY19DRAFT_960231 [Irpex rosettiformis]